MIDQTPVALLFESHFTGKQSSNRGGSVGASRKQWRQKSESTTATHNLAPAIRQIIRCLAASLGSGYFIDPRGGCWMEVCLFGSLLCLTVISPLWSLSVAQADPRAEPAAVPALRSLPAGLFVLRANPFVPLIHANRCPATGLSRRKL